MIAIPIARTRLALLHKSLLTCQLLVKHNQALCCSMMQQKRNIRGVRKIFRDHLPRYRNNLYSLEPLTEMLTSDEIGRQVNSLNDLWTRKLEIYRQYLPDRQKPILLEGIFNSKNNIDALLRLIDENLTTMTSFYVACSFEALDDMMRLGECDIATVMVSPEFKRLSTRALYKMRFFESDEVLKLIKCLSTVRLPEDLLLTQSAFQMARFMINDFNTDELETLSDCLETFEIVDSSPKSLLLALRQAIPIAQKYQIDEKLITRSASNEAKRLEQGSYQEQDDGSITR